MARRFQYRAVNPSGAVLAGVLEGESAAEISLRLDRMGYIPVRVAVRRDLRGFVPGLRRRPVPHHALIVFTQQLCTLHRAGIPLIQALAILVRQTEHAGLRKAIQSVADDVRSGVSLGEAFGHQVGTFGRAFCAGISAGEASGQLDQVLERLAEFLEREHRVREEIKDAMRYPVMVLLALGGAFLVVVAFVFPRFATFYSHGGVALPLPTRLMMILSDFLRHYAVLIAAGAAAVVIAIRVWLHSERGGAWFDRVRLGLPVVGRVFLKVSLSRLAHLLTIMLRGGLPVVGALRATRTAIGNRLVSAELARLESGFIEGRDVRRLLESSTVLPAMVAQVFIVGLESGQLDRMLSEMARHYDREVEYATRRLTKTVEPVFTLVIGSAVLTLALSVLLPAWSMLEVIRK